MDHSALTKKMHSQSVLMISALIVGACAIWAYLSAGACGFEPTMGFVKGWGSALPLPDEAFLTLGLALNCGIVVLMLLINKAYILFRGTTRLQPTSFLFMQLATPLALCSLCSGTLLALVVLWCVSLLYSLYGQEFCDTRKVFLVFALLSACTAFDYAYVIYILTFIVVCMQLRAFSLRSVLATATGLATPWIILFGFGVITLDDLQMPYQGIFWPDGGLSLPMFTAFFTAFLALATLSRNIVKYIGYNARLRAMIGVVTLLTVVTLVATFVDIDNVYNYLPMLNVCASFQVAHLFTSVHNKGKAYMCVLAIILLYIVIYALGL